MKTLKELAQRALDVQSAVNLSGVVHSFSQDITDLRKILETQEGFSTTMLNEHPICFLYAVQIAFLTRTNDLCDDSGKYSRAYDWCVKQAE